MLLTHAVFSGQGTVVMEAATSDRLNCTVQVSADSAALRRLGVRASCPSATPEPKVLVAIDVQPENQSFSFDETETHELDNGDCEVDAVAPSEGP